MSEPELWVARDEDTHSLRGRLRLYCGKPYEVIRCGLVGNAVCELPTVLLPSLAPGSKCRVKIVPLTDEAK